MSADRFKLALQLFDGKIRGEDATRLARAFYVLTSVANYESLTAGYEKLQTLFPSHVEVSSITRMSTF